MTSKKTAQEKLMVGVGKLVSTQPAKISILFIIITLLMLMPMSQLELESDMDDFNPDNEFKDTGDMIWGEFNTTYSIPNIIEAEDGNILDREGMELLMEMEADIRASDMIDPYLVTYQDGVTSIADVVEAILRMMSNEVYGITDAPDGC